MATMYSSPKIARELGKRFGDQAQTVKVQMKYTKAVEQFVRKVEAAHQCTAKSKQVFK